MLLPALTALYGIIAAGSMLLRLASVAATYSCYAFPPMVHERFTARRRYVSPLSSQGSSLNAAYTVLQSSRSLYSLRRRVTSLTDCLRGETNSPLWPQLCLSGLELWPRDT